MTVPSKVDVARLATVDDCTSCHADVASHWENSAHARSSFDNPWYRASVDEFRAERGHRASRFCAGCHDPLLVASGDIDGDIEPHDDLAYAGITCTTCHSVDATTLDGNGSFALSDQAILIPDPAVPAEIEAHRRRLTMTPLRTEALCGSCHRSFTGPAIGNEHHLTGIDDMGHWRESTFGHGVPNRLIETAGKRCQDCHMSPEGAPLGDLAATEGRVSNHRWAASHTALADQVGETTLDRTRASLESSAIIDIGAVSVGKRRALLPESAEVLGGEPLTIDVLIENTGVGHRFPGGTRDMHDVWLEVEVSDATGRVIGVSRPDGESRDGVHLLRATVLDREGNPELLHQVHEFSTVAFDKTLLPHATRIIRYRLKTPKGTRTPLRVDARLVHRKHSLAFQRFACEASRSPRGRAFAEGTAERGKTPLDPCLPQPVTVVAEATDWVGPLPDGAGRVGGAARPKEERWLAGARGLLGETQERIELVRASLRPILEAEDVTPELEARATLLLARMFARQGRVEDAVEATSRVEALVGARPALDRIRGNAFARTWRWEEAEAAYARVARAAPGSVTAWRDLARAAGSLGHDLDSLHAADAGLALAPRDEGLLRSRALALRGLGHPDAELAEDAWLRHRSPDTAPANLARCERKHVRCQTDRQPIPQYSLVPPPRKAIHASVISR